MDLLGTSIVVLFCLGMTGGCAALIWDVISDGDWVALLGGACLSCIAAVFPLVGIMAVIDYLVIK
jgi:hypothetical protein